MSREIQRFGSVKDLFWCNGLCIALVGFTGAEWSGGRSGYENLLRYLLVVYFEIQN